MAQELHRNITHTPRSLPSAQAGFMFPNQKPVLGVGTGHTQGWRGLDSQKGDSGATCWPGSLGPF